jgi:hypothetical protein
VTVFAKPALAIAFGAFIFCAETCLHADTLVTAASAPFDLPYYDWLAAGFLIVAGVLSQRAWTDVRRQNQAVAWAFMLSLLVGAFLASLGEWAVPPSESEWGISEGAFLVIIGGLCVVALCALVSTIRNPRR